MKDVQDALDQVIREQFLDRAAVPLTGKGVKDLSRRCGLSVKEIREGVDRLYQAGEVFLEVDAFGAVATPIPGSRSDWRTPEIDSTESLSAEEVPS